MGTRSSPRTDKLRLARVLISWQALVGLARINRQHRDQPNPNGRCRRRNRRKGRVADRIERPGLVAMGTVIEPVPVTGLAANFSPIPRMAPPPLGNEIVGGATCCAPLARTSFRASSPRSGIDIALLEQALIFLSKRSGTTRTNCLGYGLAFSPETLKRTQGMVIQRCRSPCPV